jgi:hypothetical protein
LGAVAAILGTATGLDRQERRQLDFVGIKIRTMDLLRLPHQIIERQFKQRSHFSDRPDLVGGSGSSDFFGGGVKGDGLR